jgi:hypothetical protein
LKRLMHSAVSDDDGTTGRGRAQGAKW